MNNWPEIKKLFKKAFNSNFHYAMASVNPDGTPHVTPIGSVFLTEENKGIYFERFTKQMPKNFESLNRVCIMAVHSHPIYMLKSLIFGQYVTPPAIRLTGTIGKRREATEQEMKLWNQRVGRFKLFKGYNLLWKNMRTVRDIHFDGVLPVRLGKMTKE